MRIYVNGEAREVADDCTAQRLVEELGLVGRRLAMEVNLDIVPRSSYATHRFNPDDRVEIVHAIGGG